MIIRRTHPPVGRPLRVLIASARFSENHAWSEIPDHWPPSLRSHVEIETVAASALAARVGDHDGAPVDVVVPCGAAVTTETIRAGRFGLVQQFGAGIESVDLAAAEQACVWVANMPGLNAVAVAEHAIALLLALARRLPEAGRGFQPGCWGEPAGRSLAGTTACVIGAGAIGRHIARRLRAFEVTVVGTLRHPPADPTPFHAIYPASHAAAAVADADSVLVAASHRRGAPPIVERGLIAGFRHGAMLVNVARGAVLDHDAALERLRDGRLGGLGLDVYPQEPYPQDGPLLSHPRVVATAHTAALTDECFEAASRRLGDALQRYLAGESPAHLATKWDIGSRGRRTGG